MAHLAVGMPGIAGTHLLEKGNTEFAQSATKTFGWKSHGLDLLIAAIKDYQNHPGEGCLQAVFAGLVSWQASNPKESMSTHRGSMALALAQEIILTAQQRGWKLWVLPASALIQDVLEKLNQCKNFACTDVGTFAGDINQRLSEAQREAIYLRGTGHGHATGIPFIPPAAGNAAGDWNPNDLRTAYDNVYKYRAGECTSFAKAAAHILSTHAPGPRILPRIEIVSYRWRGRGPRFNGEGQPIYVKDATGQFTNRQAMEAKFITHVFCVVGRSGQDVQHNQPMPQSNSWGDDCCIVDCWLGALGYDCWFTVGRYPKLGYLTGGFVFKEMDSYQGPDAVYAVY